ncbi:MAG TPA: hypothetical protein VL728_15955 [Cyclobacteriaceae bacterium]|nr:hypothetical protein [Cyclobacteriaceae bacterium]
MKGKLHTRLLVQSIILLTLWFCEIAAFAQSTESSSSANLDTVSVFDSRLKITLTAHTFEKLPPQVSAGQFSGVFNLHDVTTASGFVLKGKDTLVFFLTSIDRPRGNDGGIATWQLINSILDKAQGYRTESGWNKLGRDYLYFVKLIVNDCLFECNFFFIDEKLTFSLLARHVKVFDLLPPESFTLISPK